MFGSLIPPLFSPQKRTGSSGLISSLINSKAEDFPLRKRKLLTQQDYELYQLVKHFYEGRDVLVKTSLSRIVVSSDEKQRHDIYQSIRNLVFLFVVIDAETDVVACIDFYSTNSKKLEDVRLKASITASLGIDYWVLGSDFSEDLTSIREKYKYLKFNFEQLDESFSPVDSTSFEYVKNRLHQLLKDRRNEVSSISDSRPNGSGFSSSSNSFLQRLHQQ